MNEGIRLNAWSEVGIPHIMFASCLVAFLFGTVLTQILGLLFNSVSKIQIESMDFWAMDVNQRQSVYLACSRPRV